MYQRTYNEHLEDLFKQYLVHTNPVTKSVLLGIIEDVVSRKLKQPKKMMENGE